ncbi:MAG TPA: hypothetical protein VFW78_02875 [Bacteroidia bacterium]|nr:hypothetical protein [Bacteroidia bacterium]
MILFAACNNAGSKEDLSYQNNSNITHPGDTLLNPSDIDTSTETGATSSKEIAYVDFEKLERDALEDAVYLVEQKGFQQSAKTVDKGTTKYFFQRINPDELLEVTSQRFDDGGRNFLIDYYTANEEHYNNFLKSLKQYKFNRTANSTFVKQDTGTYESVQISGNGRVLKNSNNYFWIRYYQNEGKELSTAIPVTPGE